MRGVFVNTIVECARRDPSIWLLTADLGYSVLEPFRDEFPRRFVNVGVAEGNMVGVASGLAASGKTVFIYSIIPFVTMRCFEQIRVDVCYQNLNVKVVGVGAGMTYGAQGATHHAIEDIAVMRALPNMTVVCPGDVVEAACAARAVAGLNGPAYVRLSRGGTPRVHRGSVHFQLGQAITMGKGTDVTLISTCHILDCATGAARMLRDTGISVQLLSMHTVKPIDRAAIERAARRSSAVFTIEEHSVVGGLGSAVAEVIAGTPMRVPLVCIGLPDRFLREIGSQEYLRRIVGLTPAAVARKVQMTLSDVGRMRAAS